MAEFGKVYHRLWRNRRFKALSDSGKLLLVYLFANRHKNAIGYYELPKYDVCSDLDWDPDKVTETISELYRTKFIRYDSDAEVVLMPTWFEHNPIKTTNNAKKAASDFSNLPTNDLTDDFLQMCSVLDRDYHQPLVETISKIVPNKNKLCSQEKFENKILDGNPEDEDEEENEDKAATSKVDESTSRRKPDSGDGPSAHPEDESEIEPGDKPLEAVLETEEQSEDDDRKLVKDAVILMADSSPTMQMAIANQGDLDAMILKWRAKVSCYAWLMFCLGVMWTRAKRHVDGLNDPFPPAKINDPIKYLWAIVFSRKRNRDPTFRLVVDGKELIFDERRPTWWFYETFFGPVETVV